MLKLGRGSYGQVYADESAHHRAVKRTKITDSGNWLNANNFTEAAIAANLKYMDIRNFVHVEDVTVNARGDIAIVMERGDSSLYDYIKVSVVFVFTTR